MEALVDCGTNTADERIVFVDAMQLAQEFAAALHEHSAHEQESVSRYPVRLDMNTKTSIMAAIILAMGESDDGEPLTVEQAISAAVDLEQAVTTRVRELKAHAKPMNGAKHGVA